MLPRPLRTALLLVPLPCVSCDWVSLARHSLTYRTTARGETASLAAVGSVLYASLAEDGFRIVDEMTGGTIATVPAPDGAESVDDLAVAGDLLFALDARPPGHVAVYSIRDARAPRLLGPAREVPVGPFSGITARGGVCIVSGGTSALTVWRYDSAGALDGPIATGDFGRGQPDVLISPWDRLAFVSTHYWGPYFGLDVVRYDSAGALRLLAELELDGAGFTTGGAKPASFPIAAAAPDAATVLVAHARGLAVIDVTRPEAPRLVRTIALGGPAVSLAVLGGTALAAVAGPQPALVLADFAGGIAGWRRIPLPPGTIPGGVALTATRAAVAVGPRGVLVFQR